MGHIFNPVQEGDWQSLNMLLERLSHGVQPIEGTSLKSARAIPEAFKIDASDLEGVGDVEDDEDEEGTDEPDPIVPPDPNLTPRQLKKQARLLRKAERKAKRQAAKDARKKKKEQKAISREYATNVSKVTSTPVVSIPGEQGIEAFSDAPQFNITLPKDAIVYKTYAKIAMPSSYFLDLRVYCSGHSFDIDADIAIVHDANGNTITLESVSETADITTAGPVSGGRDQSGAFTDDTWVYGYIIYNPSTKDVGSIISSSPTSPTLPAGFTYYVRVAAGWVDAATHDLMTSYQMGDRVTYSIQWAKWDTHPSLWPEEIDLTNYVPATAKMVHGVIGISSGSTAGKIRVSPDSGGVILVGAWSDGQGSADQNYGVAGSKDFSLPLWETQTMYWGTGNTSDIYAVGIVGFTDDL